MSRPSQGSSVIRQLARGCFIAALTASVLATSLLVSNTPSLLAQEDDAWPSIVRAKPFVIDDEDSELLKLRKTVFNSAIKELQISFQSHRLGLGDSESHIDSLYAASRRLTDAALELYPDEAHRAEFLQGQVTIAVIREATAEARWIAGADTELKYHHARFDRLGAEIKLMKARLAWEKEKKKEPANK